MITRSARAQSLGQRRPTADIANACSMDAFALKDWGQRLLPATNATRISTRAFGATAMMARRRRKSTVPNVTSAPTTSGIAKEANSGLGAVVLRRTDLDRHQLETTTSFVLERHQATNATRISTR